MKITVKQAMEVLTEAVRQDPDYAWTWQANLAASAFDEGMEIDAANRAAARFMKLLFKVDMTKHKLFVNTQVK